jgi:hypothetical protein
VDLPVETEGALHHRSRFHPLTQGPIMNKIISALIAGLFAAGAFAQAPAAPVATPAPAVVAAPAAPAANAEAKATKTTMHAKKGTTHAAKKMKHAKKAAA